MPVFPGHRRPEMDAANFPPLPGASVPANDGEHPSNADGNFDDAEAEPIDDDDGLDDGSEMIIDTQPLLGPNNFAGAGTTGNNQIPPPPPTHHPMVGGVFVPPVPGFPPPNVHFPDDIEAYTQYIPPAPASPETDDGGDDAMDVSPVGSAAAASASTAPVGGRNGSHQSARNRTASAAGPSGAHAGPSTASTQGASGPSRAREGTPYPGLDHTANGEASSSGNSPEGA